jgi:hypothetical protein
MMTVEQLLKQVSDRQTFVSFVRALASEREDAERIEREQPDRYVLDGAHNWKNADIASYLFACLDYFREKPFHKPATDPSWQMLAEFLYFGKIIES